MINKTIAVLLSSLLRLTNALPTFTTDVVEGPIHSSSDLLPSTAQDWAELARLDGTHHGSQGEILSYYNEMKFDGHDSTSTPPEQPNPILETSSTPHSFFNNSSKRISIYNTEPVSRISSISDRSALAIEPTPISMQSIPKSSETRKEKIV
jgi:hypothetical protein